MDECSQLVCYISSEIFATNHVPSLVEFIIELTLQNSGHFAIFLSLWDPNQIRDFFNGSICNADNSTLILRLHIRHSNQDLFMRFGGFILVLLLKFLLPLLIRHEYTRNIVKKYYKLSFIYLFYADQN